MIARRTNLTKIGRPRSSRLQRLALLLLLPGTSFTAGCYLALDTGSLDARAAGTRTVADAGVASDAGPSSGFTTSLDTPAIELDLQGTTTRDPCVATTQQARDILTTHCAECHAPPGAAAGFSSVLDFPTLTTLRSATQQDPVTMEFVRLLIPGQPEKSRLYLRVRNGEMPPTRPPTERQLPRPTTSSISVLRTWIESCLGNYDPTPAAPAGAQ